MAPKTDLRQIVWIGKSLLRQVACHHHLSFRCISVAAPPHSIQHRLSQITVLRSASSLSQPQSQPPGNVPSKVNSSSTVTPEENLNAPIQFTTSEASQWLASETLFMKPRRPSPWYQPHIVCFSVGCLLIWFGILREENDMDEIIGTPLWERIPGLEKTQLMTLIKYNKEKGEPTADLEARLNAINAREESGLRK